MKNSVFLPLFGIKLKIKKKKKKKKKNTQEHKNKNRNLDLITNTIREFLLYGIFYLFFSKTNTNINPYRLKKLNPLGLDSQIRVNSQTLSLSPNFLFLSHLSH